MGANIVFFDFNPRVFPVNQMPGPDYNIYNAIQTLTSGGNSSIALNVLRRDASYVLNDITANMTEFQTLFNNSLTALKKLNASSNKILYSLLTKLLLPYCLNKVTNMGFFNLLELILFISVS